MFAGLAPILNNFLTPFLMYCLRKAFGFLMMLLCFSSFLLVTLFERCVCDLEHIQGRTERRRVIMHNRCQLDSKQREDDFIFSYLLALSFAPNVLLRERKSRLSISTLFVIPTPTILQSSSHPSCRRDHDAIILLPPSCLFSYNESTNPSFVTASCNFSKAFIVTSGNSLFLPQR